MIGEENTLEGFDGWSELSTETDFFSIPQGDEEQKTDVESVLEKIKNDDKSEEEEEEGKGEEDLFKTEETIENIEKVNNEEEEELPQGSNVSALNILKEKGLLEFELEEGEELTDELADELIVDKWDESVDARVKEVLSELPERAKSIIQFAINGGDIDDYIDSLGSSNAGFSLDIDLDKEENQITALKYLLKLEDKDDEEIETEIEYLKDTNKLKTISEKKFNKYKTEAESRQQQLLQEQAKAKENEKKLVKEAKARVSSFLTENEEVDGIKFTKDDKKSLPAYMNDKVVKLQNGNTITMMQKELFIDLPKNEKALIQLATLLKNRNEDGTFNFDSIAKSVTTDVTKKVKDNIRRNKTSIPGSSQNKEQVNNKSLADYFNN